MTNILYVFVGRVCYFYLPFLWQGIWLERSCYFSLFSSKQIGFGELGNPNKVWHWDRGPRESKKDLSLRPHFSFEKDTRLSSWKHKIRGRMRILLNCSPCKRTREMASPLPKSYFFIRESPCLPQILFFIGILRKDMKRTAGKESAQLRLDFFPAALFTLGSPTALFMHCADNVPDAPR